MRESVGYLANFPCSGSTSERLGNLVQLRRTIRVKSPLPRGAFDHAIGWNEHGDRVRRGIIVTKPWQRTAWTPHRCSAILCSRSSRASRSTVAAVSSIKRNATTGVFDDNAARGPCCNSAALKPSAGNRSTSASFSAISRAELRPKPREATNTADAPAR